VTRAVGVAAVATLLMAIGLGRLPNSRATGSTSSDVTTLAVLSAHVAYEGALVDGVRARLSPADAPVAIAVRSLTATLGVQLSAALRRDGQTPAEAGAIWARVIGDGAVPPSRVLLYVCSVHALESDHAELDAAPPSALGGLLGEIELTLALEGRQLANRLTGPVGAAADHGQRELLHVIAPLVISSDRAFAASA